MYTVVQSQNAASAYFKSKQMLPFGFAEQYNNIQIHQHMICLYSTNAWLDTYENAILPKNIFQCLIILNLYIYISFNFVGTITFCKLYHVTKPSTRRRQCLRLQTLTCRSHHVDTMKEIPKIITTKRPF